MCLLRDKGNVLWKKVSDGLQQGLSPEQVAGTLKRMSEPVRLCHETIYQAIYAMPKGELRTETIALLRQGHNKRQPRTRGEDRRRMRSGHTVHGTQAGRQEELLQLHHTVPKHGELGGIFGGINEYRIM